jgi:hypothetical protein
MANSTVVGSGLVGEVSRRAHRRDKAERQLGTVGKLMWGRASLIGCNSTWEDGSAFTGKVLPYLDYRERFVDIMDIIGA